MAIVIILFCGLSYPLRAATYTVSQREDVADAALLDGEFSSWNFGGGSLLETGYMVGIYTEHRAVSLLRFNVDGIPFSTIERAAVKLYVPRSFIRRYPVKAAIYGMKSDARWNEGSDICKEADTDCSWQWKGDGLKSGRDYMSVAYDTVEVSVEGGMWIEFTIPGNVIEEWMRYPERNNGFIIKTIPVANAWGEHIYFYSSEHYSDRTPRLEVEGSGEREPLVPVSGKKDKKRLHGYTRIDEESFCKWLDRGKRLANFTRMAEMNTRQAKLFYYYDVIFRRDYLLERYQIPLGKSFEAIEKAIEADDASQVRTLMNDVRKYLLVWEYIRETDWYTSGPLAEELSPWQLGVLFGRGIFGRMQEAAREENNRIWVTYERKAMRENLYRTMALMKKRLQLTPGQTRRLKPDIARMELAEHENLQAFKNDLARVQMMCDSHTDDEKMFQAVSDMHLHHEVFLYWQSIYNTPRWFLLLEKAPIIPYAQWIVDTRKRMYAREANLRQLKEIGRYLQTEND